MKKFLMYAFILLAAIQVKAQQSVVFKVKYLPEHNYQTSTKLSVKLLVNLAGSKEFLDKLNSQGIKQPVNADVSLGINGNIKTGSKAPDNSFPLNMEYKISDISVKANDKEFPIPQKEKSFKLYGHTNADGLLKIDSAEGKKVNDTSERKMKQMMNLVQKQIQFPDKPLKIGDTFTQGVPMTIPMKGNDIKVDASVTYKLISISGGKAYFDMVQTLNVNAQMKKGTVSVTGSGTGKMVYSINDNFPLSVNGNLAIKMKANIDTLNVDGTAAIITEQSTVIN